MAVWETRATAIVWVQAGHPSHLVQLPLHLPLPLLLAALLLLQQLRLSLLVLVLPLPAGKRCETTSTHGNRDA